MHYEEEDSRQLYVVMSKTHCHLKLPGRLRREGHDVFQQYLWHLYIGLFFVEAIAGIWMLYVLLVMSSSRQKIKETQVAYLWHTSALEILETQHPSMMALLL